MKFDHSGGYFYKYDTDSFSIEYDFTNDLGTETLASATVVCTDSDGNNTSTDMISGISVVSPDVFFTAKAGTIGKLYSIKVVGTTTDSKIYTGYISCEVFGGITLNSKLGDANANSYVTLTQANEIIMNKYGHLDLWDTLTSEGKKRVLIQAARDIDNNNFIGEKYYTTQNTEFPRNTHDVISGDCATPFTINSFVNSNLYSDTYNQYPQNYWKYGSCHITVGTPIRDIRLIEESSATNGGITLFENLSATPNANTDFLIFAPIDKTIQEAQCEQALYILQTKSMSTLSNYKTIGADKVKIGDVEVNFKSSAGSYSTQTVAPNSKKLLSKFISNRYYVYRA